MSLISGVRRHATKLAFVTGMAASVSALAGDRAQVDLSVSVNMAPATFAQSGHNVFSVTVHNAGPDDAGTSNPDDRPIGVYGSSLIFPYDVGPPLEIVGVLSGDCWIFRFSEPLPNGNWIVQFSYFFDPIAAGASRTCTSDIYFSASAPTQIATNWRVSSPNDTDTNPANDRFDYTFLAAAPPATSVPGGSPIAWLTLGLGLTIAAGAAHGRTRSPFYIPVADHRLRVSPAYVGRIRARSSRPALRRSSRSGNSRSPNSWEGT